MHLVSFNVAKMRAPIDDPIMAGFVDGLDEINALAEASPGFVWRMVDDARDGESARPDHDDPLVIASLAVWESLEHLRAYVYKSGHTDYLRRRREWFQPMDGPTVALWWAEPGVRPRLADGAAKLRALATSGPSDSVFGFGRTSGAT